MIGGTNSYSSPPAQGASSRVFIMATWDDAPHLDDDTKRELWESIPPYQRDARTKGIPQLGSGAIYPESEENLLVDDFELPSFWPRAFGMDVGWNATAALWGAWDRESDTVYIYSEYKRGEEKPAVHAQAIKSRGDWIPGAIDPASRGRSQVDGKALLKAYRSDYSMNIKTADNAVEAGIHKVWERISTGRIKIFKSCRALLEEYRLYRRDDKGKVVKDNDHLMDCLRYLIMTGMRMACKRPIDPQEVEDNYGYRTRNAVTGY